MAQVSYKFSRVGDNSADPFMHARVWKIPTMLR